MLRHHVGAYFIIFECFSSSFNNVVIILIENQFEYIS